MNRVAKKITLVATSLTLALGMSMSVMAAKNDSNKCGKNAIYEFNKSTRTLTIQGKGTVKGKHSWKKLKPKKVVIKDGITEIGYSAFASLKTLRSVIIPNSVRKIDGYAFECSSLKKLNLPKSVEVIGTGAFSETKLKEVTVPKSVKKMGSYVFGSCGRLKKVEWNYSYIPARTFSYCTSLDKISIKSKVQHIGIEALEGTAIKAFTVPSSVTNMQAVFQDCTNLTELDVSNWDTSKVTNMSYFLGGEEDKKIRKLDVSKWDTGKVTNMSHMFALCSKLSHIYASSKWNTSNVTSSAYMFYNCTSLPNFDSSKIDKTNAFIGGYLEEK